jgi:hypothetical protein
MAPPRGLGDDGVDLVAIEPADWFAVEQRRGRERTIAEAIDGLDVKRRGAVGVIHCNAVRVAKMGDQVFTAERLARFGPAKLELRPCKRGAAKIVIEADDAENLGAREIERLGDLGDRRVVDIAKAVLQCVEDRQRGARFGALGRD